MKWGLNAKEWTRWFAWKPVKLIDGRWVWWEWIEVTGYVENSDVQVHHKYNVRIFSTSFAARPIRD